MPGEISTIQSLKAVDAWIDVINSNINGGVRTAFKASRLKFGGSNTNIDRAGNATSLPLQFPEPSLVTQNTVIDFTQGAVTASTENSHLAIQGTGWFMVTNTVNAAGQFSMTANTRMFLTRDGEFRTNQNGLLVNSSGYYLVTSFISVGATASQILESRTRAVYNNLDVTTTNATLTNAVRLSDFLTNNFTSVTTMADGNTADLSSIASIAKVTLGQQSLQYTQFGSTVFSFGYVSTATAGTAGMDANIRAQNATATDAVLNNKSLEASNASMTQSVPELSLAQKLFSALTKVLQTKQTNIDGVINLIR
jgi:flagellar hook protein FlgE